MAKRKRNKRKADSDLFELVDVANLLLHKSVIDIFYIRYLTSQNVVITVNVSMSQSSSEMSSRGIA